MTAAFTTRQHDYAGDGFRRSLMPHFGKSRQVRLGRRHTLSARPPAGWRHIFPPGRYSASRNGRPPAFRWRDEDFTSRCAIFHQRARPKLFLGRDVSAARAGSCCRRLFRGPQFPSHVASCSRYWSSASLKSHASSRPAGRLLFQLHRRRYGHKAALSIHLLLRNTIVDADHAGAQCHYRPHGRINYISVASCRFRRAQKQRRVDCLCHIVEASAIPAEFQDASFSLRRLSAADKVARRRAILTRPTKARNDISSRQ